jgi:hypothetical protein
MSLERADALHRILEEFYLLDQCKDGIPGFDTGGKQSQAAKTAMQGVASADNTSFRFSSTCWFMWLGHQMA